MANHRMSDDELQARFIQFGLAVIRSTQRPRRDFAWRHIVHQLIRAATSPSAHYAEATGAESRRDFIHKLQMCLKELRETAVWLAYKDGLVGIDSNAVALRHECGALTGIVVSSIRTARRNEG